MTIAYYRGILDEYKDHPAVKALIEQSRNCDYIIAPIADNRMFQIINSFIAGDLTDEQCKHCLAATNGQNYLFRTAPYMMIISRLIEQDHYFDNTSTLQKCSLVSLS